MARAAQAKLPDPPGFHGRPQPPPVPQPPPTRTVSSEPARRTLATAQAKLTPPQARPPAPHVQNAVAAVQRKGAALPAVPRPPAPAPPVRAVQRKLPEKAPVHAPAPGTPAARVLQAAKIKDLPNYKKLDLCQSYTAKYYNYGTSRYVMLNFAAAAGWHITFFPGNPASDPYQEDVLTNFMNEDNTGDYRWRQNYDQIGELDYKEFHVTTGELHRGTAKHFFYREDGSFLREEGAGITDADRKMADMLRATIVPAARVGAYQAPVAAAAAAVPAAAAPAAPQQLWYQNPHVVAAMVDAPVPLGSSLKDRLKRLDGSS